MIDDAAGFLLISVPQQGGQITSIAPVASASVALLAALIAAASLRTARAAYYQSRSTLATQVRKEWDALHADWTTALSLSEGPSEYYSGASAEQREALRRLACDYAAIIESNIGSAQQLVQNYAAAVHKVTGFLDMCASLALSNRLDVSDIYTVLGPDVARHGRSVRWMLGMVDHRWWPDDLPLALQDETWWLDPARDRSSFARRQRIMALIDLLWAQASRTGDREPHVLMRVAVHKLGGSGAACRRRVRRLARQLSGTRHAFRLARTLSYSEMVPISSVYQEGRYWPGSVDFRVVRLGFIRWRLRNMRSWMESFRPTHDAYRLQLREMNQKAGGDQFNRLP